MSGRRLPSGGLIDRSRPIAFRFDGMPLVGFPGDTIASALIANDVLLAGRSFKLHRPRGFFGAGYDDGIMVERVAPRAATNQLAAVTPLEAGGDYRSVSTWPNARLILVRSTACSGGCCRRVLLQDLHVADISAVRALHPACGWPGPRAGGRVGARFRSAFRRL